MRCMNNCALKERLGKSHCQGLGVEGVELGSFTRGTTSSSLSIFTQVVTNKKIPENVDFLKKLSLSQVHTNDEQTTNNRITP